MIRSAKRAVLQVWVGDKQEPRLVNCLESPSDAEITEQLGFLPGGDQISVIEIHISKTHHIAVGGSKKEGFHALYHEFSKAGEWESVRDDLPDKIAAQLLAGYRDQTADWKRLIEWRRCIIAPALEQQRAEQEAEKVALWIAKAVAFVTGFLDKNSKPSRKRRK